MAPCLIFRYNQYFSARMEEELAAARTVLLQASGEEARQLSGGDDAHAGKGNPPRSAATPHSAHEQTREVCSALTSGHEQLPGSPSLQLVLTTASAPDVGTLGRWLKAATPQVDVPCSPQRHLLRVSIGLRYIRGSTAMRLEMDVRELRSVASWSESTQRIHYVSDRGWTQTDNLGSGTMFKVVLQTGWHGCANSPVRAPLQEW